MASQPYDEVAAEQLSAVQWRSVAVVMPAYNESDGLREFIEEIDAYLSPIVGRLQFVVVDDASEVSLSDALTDVDLPASTCVQVIRNVQNLGHGRSVLRACKAGLSTGADAIIHVDGDGQFCGSDFPQLLMELKSCDIVHGARASRTDPWFRRILTRSLRRSLATAGYVTADVNTPLRAYRPWPLMALISQIPRTSVVPHVHFTILERAMEVEVREITVSHQERRGATTTGSTWSNGPLCRILPSRRLVRLCATALKELVVTHVIGQRKSALVPARNDDIRSQAA